VLAQLVELGPPSELRLRGPSIAAATFDFDRVLLSSVGDGTLVATALHVPEPAAARELLELLQQQPVALDYPLVEGEVMRRRRAQIVRSTPDRPTPRGAFSELLGWADYVIAPVILDGRVIGFLQADRQPSGRELSDADAAALAGFAVCFALVYERAVLRHRLRVQLNDLRELVGWADARAGELGERAISLEETTGTRQPASAPPARIDATAGLRDLLTRRELDVLALIVAGHTNAGIARELVVSEGTIKFHVKNILRKLHASNRAEATSRYLRLTLGRRRPSG
jgi:DNA-binding CsgD family transcriptional regulator